ncbi:MAG: helix-turn-helix domain-containing protein [bacterium]
MSIQTNLENIGLTEKEAKVYLAALELGPASIQALTKKSAIKRSTVYEMIKNLKKAGLMSETIKGKRRLFIAAEPETLKRIIKQKEKMLSEIMPELKSISNIGFTKPKVMYYEGREGIREIFWDTIKIKTGMAYWISIIDELTALVGEDFVYKYIEEKAKRGLWIKSILITSKQPSNYKYLDPLTYERTLRKVRFTPKELDFSNTIAIYGNRVAIISTRKEGFGFVVESEDYAKSMKVFYDLLWNISKPYGDMGFRN